jgi:hypothetical protein
MIANTHKAIADKFPSGTHSTECKECAMLFAWAIDARKTGEIVNLDRIKMFKQKYCQTYPGWMMKFDKPQMDPPNTSISEKLKMHGLTQTIIKTFYDLLRMLNFP